MENEIIFMFIKAFVVGGIICVIAQILINYTKITSGRILVSFLLIGVCLQAFGLYQYLVNANVESFQPINANFGILNPIDVRDKKQRYVEYGIRSKQEIENILNVLNN